jgi:hypothetical protein
MHEREKERKIKRKEGERVRERTGERQRGWERDEKNP